MRRCSKCGAPWTEEGQPPFNTVCRKCLAEIHACLNCRLYAPYAHNRCRSSTTEPVRDPAGGNFCEEFDFKDAAEAPQKKTSDAGKDKLRKLLGD